MLSFIMMFLLNFLVFILCLGIGGALNEYLHFNSFVSAFIMYALYITYLILIY